MSKKHTATVRRQFTKTVEAFSETATRDTPEAVVERVAFARPAPHDLALDVGCGPGTFALALALRVQFVRGLDLTHAMLLKAGQFRRRQKIHNACFDEGEAERLPYPKAQFDLVTCQFAFHRLQKPRAALAEMMRVAKPDARFMIADTLGPESDEKWNLHNHIQQIRDPSHVASLRLTAFLKLFEESGLEITRQTVKRRERSFNAWMQRAGLELSDARYREVQKLIEEAIPGDKAGFSARPQADDLLVLHNEGMFLLRAL